MSRYKAAFFDVDGTLLSHSTGEIPKSTVEALARMRENGIRLVICSGRHPGELKKLNIDLGMFDDFVTTNGQIVLNSRFEVIAENPLPGERMSILTDEFNSRRTAMQFNNMEGIYLNFVDDRVRDILAQIHTPVHRVGEYGGEKIYQVVAYADESNPWVEKVKKYFHVTRWHPDGIDIITEGGGKDWGMQAYIKDRGISRSETIAFGDGENDLAMIRFAACGVAMGNSCDILKEASDYVTDDIDSDGLYMAADHFGLI